MPAQMPFHESGARIRLIMGGTGSGKTEPACAELASALMGVSPWWMKNRYPKPPLHAWVVKPKYPSNMLTEPVCSKMWFGERHYDPYTLAEYMREPFIPKRMQEGYNKSNFTFTLTNGSTFTFKSSEAESLNIAGEAFDLALLDEPCRHQFWEELRYRMIRRPSSKLWFAMTPNISTSYLDEMLESEDREMYHYIFLDTRRNDYLGDKVKQQIVDATPEWEREERLQGKPVIRTGLVYQTLQRGGPNYVPVDAVRPHWPIYACIDPGINNPMACVWCAVSEIGDKYMFDVVYEEKRQTNINVMAQMFRQRGHDVKKWFIDPFAAAQATWTSGDQRHEENLLKLFRKAGLPVLMGPKEYESSGRVQRAEQTNLWADLGCRAKPNLYIVDSPSTAPLQKELRLYKWQKNDRDENQKLDTIHKFDHAIYCMETLCVLNEVRFEIDQSIRPYQYKDIPLKEQVRRESERAWRRLTSGQGTDPRLELG